MNLLIHFTSDQILIHCASQRHLQIAIIQLRCFFLVRCGLLAYTVRFSVLSFVLARGLIRCWSLLVLGHPVIHPFQVELMNKVSVHSSLPTNIAALLKLCTTATSTFVPKQGSVTTWTLPHLPQLPGFQIRETASRPAAVIWHQPHAPPIQSQTSVPRVCPRMPRADLGHVTETIFTRRGSGHRIGLPTFTWVIASSLAARNQPAFTAAPASTPTPTPT
ncbi:hypothetical protein BDV11DRAFT_93355 [Aspergillus similis]